MPVSVFSSKSQKVENKPDVSSFVQNPDLRTNFLEKKFAKDIDMKIQFKNIFLHNPFDSQDVVEKSYVHDMENNHIVTGNTKPVEFNDKNVDNVRFDKLNSPPAVREQLTPKLYVNQSVNEPTLEKIIHNDDFNSHFSTNSSV